MTLGKELVDSDAWGSLSTREYGVLYALSKAPEGARMADLCADALLTQAGMSRLVGRLEDRRLIVRAPDPQDGRATVLRLTEAGTALHREVGGRHAVEVESVMTRALSPAELEQLRHLCRRLIADV
nr:MarR family transcriptional regulator [Aeromicrobium sp. CFBP 8757]